MAVNSKRAGLLVMLIPILMLLGVGGYIIWKNLEKYEKNIESLQKTLEIKHLSMLEDALDQELLCEGLNISNNGKCGNYQGDTDRLLKSQPGTTASNTYMSHLFPLLDILNPDRKHQTQTQFNMSQLNKRVHDLRKNIATGKLHKEDLISGKAHKALIEPIENYLQSTNLASASTVEQNSLRFQKEIQKSRYSSKLENMLVSYYLSLKQSIPDDMLKIWDNYIASVSVPEADNIGEIGNIKPKIKNILQSEMFQKAKNDIEDARIDIIASHSNGDYDINYNQWNKLYGTLDNAEKNIANTITDTIATTINSSLRNNEKWFWMGIVLMLLSLLFIVLLVRYYLRAKEEDVALEQVVSNIQELSLEDTGEQAGDLPPMPKNLGDRKAVYNYLEALLKKLHQKEQEAKEANEAKSQFLANMSHELRTPLNGIVGFTQILKDTNLDDEQSEFVEIIEGSSNNLLDIINDILDISKISADKMELENKEFDLFDTVESVIDMLAARAEQKGIVLGVYIDPALGAMHTGDPVKIKQVLTNLVGNAIKFTPPNGSVSILVEPVERDTDLVKFSVKDTGIGISKEDQNKIFEAFTQVDAATNRKFGGTGLGLTLSRQIISLMGGELSVESSQGSGSTFYFSISLPRTKKEIKDDIDYSESLKVGLALPDRHIHREIDTFREKYCRDLGHAVEYYYYDDLFGNDENIILPNVMIFDHDYLQHDTDTEKVISLSCKKILITKPSLQKKLHGKEESFNAIAHAPITFTKMKNAFEALNNEGDNISKNPLTTFSIDCDLSDKYVLVAEDNPINQKLIMNLLQKFGMNVKVVENGEEAINAYKTNSFDIVFMDIQMPVLGGVEATEHIKAYETEIAKAHTPIIALTANALSGDKERYIKAGMDDYLPKPIIIEQLLRILNKYFENKHPNTFQDEAEIEDENINDFEMKLDNPQEAEEVNNSNIVELAQSEELDGNISPNSEDTFESIEIEEQPKKKEIDFDMDILLFRTSDLSREIYRRILEKLNHTVECVSDENEMLDALEKRQYRYVLYDIEPFEKIDEMLQDLIKDSGAIPIIFSPTKKETSNETVAYLDMDVSREELKHVLQKYS